MPVCGEQGWGSWLSSEPTQCTTWLGARLLFYFLLTSLYLSPSFGGKKKGMDPVVESNLGALHAAWCYTFLGIYISGCQCFHSHQASYTWKVEAMLESLLGSRAFFFSKNPLKQASWLCSFTWHPGCGTTNPMRQPGRGRSVAKLHN